MKTEIWSLRSKRFTGHDDLMNLPLRYDLASYDGFLNKFHINKHSLMFELLLWPKPKRVILEQDLSVLSLKLQCWNPGIAAFHGLGCGIWIDRLDVHYSGKRYTIVLSDRLSIDCDSIVFWHKKVLPLDLEGLPPG